MCLNRHIFFFIITCRKTEKEIKVKKKTKEPIHLIPDSHKNKVSG